MKKLVERLAHEYVSGSESWMAHVRIREYIAENAPNGYFAKAFRIPPEDGPMMRSLHRGPRGVKVPAHLSADDQKVRAWLLTFLTDGEEVEVDSLVFQRWGQDIWLVAA